MDVATNLVLRRSNNGKMAATPTKLFIRFQQWRSVEGVVGGCVSASFVGVSFAKGREPSCWPESMAAMEVEVLNRGYELQLTVVAVVSSVQTYMASLEIGLKILQARLGNTIFMMVEKAAGEPGSTGHPTLGLIVAELAGLDMVFGLSLVGSDGCECGLDKVDSAETDMELKDIKDSKCRATELA
ncbi:hypothetical protein ACLB2K_044895 [Fragaria x ananassa]